MDIAVQSRSRTKVFGFDAVVPTRRAALMNPWNERMAGRK